jgi:hypothetical protein
MIKELDKITFKYQANFDELQSIKSQFAKEIEV